MTDKDEDFSNNNVCRFCEKEFTDNKVRYHCHLTGKYTGPAHIKSKINVTQKRSNFIPFLFHSFSIYQCHLLFEKLVDKKNDKVEFDIIPKRNEEYISVTNVCIRFIDGNRFLSSSLDSLVKTLVDNSHETWKDFKIEIVDNDEILNIVNEIMEQDETFKDLKKDYPEEIIKVEEALLNFMDEKDLKISETGFPDIWNYLIKKLAYV